MNATFFTVTINAGCAYDSETPATVITIKSATLPFTVAIDGTAPTAAQAGTVLHGPFNVLNFFNPNAVPITIGYYLADTQVSYSPSDSSASNAATYLYGNCGIAANGNKNLPNSNGGNTNVAADPNGYLKITNNPNIVIANLNNGHRRQMILFTIAPVAIGTGASLNILDANGNPFMTIPAGSPPVALTTDGVIWVSGVGGTAYVTIGEIYLTQ